MQIKRVSAEQDTLNDLVPKKRMRICSDNYKKPSEYVTALFQEAGFSKEEIMRRARLGHVRPTQTMIEAYTMEVSSAVRTGDLNTLRKLHKSGANLDCCNRFGDSLVHIACRLGHTPIVKFLINEVKASANVVDDLDRTALHDACWSSSLDFEIIEIMVRAAPENLLWPDKRGHTAFDYARQSDWTKWMTFLTKNTMLLMLDE